MTQQNLIKNQSKFYISDGIQKRQSSIDILNTRRTYEDSPKNGFGSINYGFGS